MFFEISISKRFVILVLGLIIFSLIGGCVAVGRIRGSQATIEISTTPVGQQFERYVGNVFVLDDIHFRISAKNRMGTYIMLFPIPIPFPIRDKPSKVPGFYVSVYFIPQKSGAVFDPQKVIFWHDPLIKQMPTRIEGPLDCKSSEPRPVTRPLPVVPFELGEAICTYMWLYFDAVLPDPSQTFFIEIRGLTFNGVERPLPAVRFQEAVSIETVAIP